MSQDSIQARSTLSRTLAGLPPPQLSQLLFALEMPRGLQPADSVPPADRATALLNWAEGTGGCGLAAVQQGLATLLAKSGALPSSPLLELSQNRPVIDSWYGRETELAELGEWLRDPAVRLIEVIGLGGYGKSALVSRLWDLPQQLPPLSQKIWLSFSLVYPFQAFAQGLLQLLGQPADDTGESEKLIARLVQQLSAQPCLLVLDNLETLSQSNEMGGYRLFLQRWLEQGRCSVVIATSREQLDWPANLRRQRCRCRRLTGLTPAAAVAFLRGQQVQGSDRELADFAELSEGHPLLMNLVVGLLWDEYGDAPPIAAWQRLKPDLFAFMGAHRGDLESSLGKIFSASFERLSDPLQQLLMAVSVYRGPFDRAMAAAMVDSKELELEALEPTLRHWVRLSLLQDQPATLTEPRRYSFLPLILRFVQRQGDLSTAHQQAASYYQTLLLPLSREAGQATVAPYLEMAYHTCELGQFETAVALLDQPTDPSEPYSSCQMVIKFRGSQAALLPLYQRILQTWQPKTSEEQRRYGDTLKAVGDVQQFLKQSREALANYEAALTIYRQVGARLGEANTLLGLGALQAGAEEALSYFQQAQQIYIDIGDLYSQGRTLAVYIAPRYRSLGQTQAAIEGFEQAAALGEAIGFEALTDYARAQIKAAEAQ